MFELRCLGSVDLRSSDKDPATRVLAQPKRFALLAYLAAASPRGFHRRDALIALFWPESDEEHARAGLRITLHFLRRELGEDVILTRGDDVALNEDVVWCDVIAFESALDSGALEQALALYRGNLLPSFHISMSPEFEHWLDSERDRLKRRAYDAALELSAIQEKAGNADGAAKWTRFALELAPDDEAVVQRMIRLLDRAGDRAGALRTYDSLAQRMMTEFESEPSPETRALVEGIRTRSSISNTFVAPLSLAPVPAISSKDIATQGPTKWRRSVLAAGGLFALVALVFAGTALWHRQGRAEVTRARIAIIPLQNQTGRSQLDHVGSLAADQIARDVGERDWGDVVPAAPGLLSKPSVGNGAELVAQVVKGTGAYLVVWGAYNLEADSLRLRVEITDATRQRLLAVVGPVSSPIAQPSEGIGRLSAQVVGSLARVFDPRMGGIIDQRGWSKPRPLEATQEFSRGVELFLSGKSRENYTKAIEHFSRAYALDTTEVSALFEIALVYHSLEEHAKADSLLARVSSFGDRLDVGEKYFLEFLIARSKGDQKEAFRLGRRSAERWPGVVWEFVTGYHALSTVRPHDALTIMTGLNPDKGFLKGVWGYRGVMAEASHVLGDHRQELELARIEREKHPQLLSAALYEARALAGLRRTQELGVVLRESQFLPPQSGLIPALPPLRGLSAGSIMTEAALELRAHQQPRESREIFNQAITWYRSRPTSEQRTEEAQRGLGEALYAANRWSESGSVFNILAQQHPKNIDYQGYLGAIAARQSRRVDAVAASEALAKWPEPYSFGLPSLWRARIASQLGDREGAISLLRRALAEGHPFGIEIHRDIDLEPLHDVPAFREFLHPQG
jgi:DNA-binding SARP family transcriptional activator